MANTTTNRQAIKTAIDLLYAELNLASKNIHEWEAADRSIHDLLGLIYEIGSQWEYFSIFFPEGE